MVPDVGYHAPEFPEHYNIYDVDGFKVYIKKNVNTENDKIEFVASTFLIFTTLEVRGVRL